MGGWRRVVERFDSRCGDVGQAEFRMKGAWDLLICDGI